MKTIRHIKVPTGDILLVKGAKGILEMLSLGDYGKDVNIKCDALGLNREIDKVEHGPLLPLKDKWVITVSTQYGCAMKCKFCDANKVLPVKNASFTDLVNQVFTGIKLHPEITSTSRLNLHYARMGEPTFNSDVLSATSYLKTRLGDKFKLHPVVSTMMPKFNNWLGLFIRSWMRIKNDIFKGNAGLQLSINSTDTNERNELFGGCASTLPEIALIMKDLIPVGRKITLNFALADYKIEPDVLLRYFNPEHYIIKLTPMHKTNSAMSNSIYTKGDYTSYTPYKKIEELLRNKGYDVLVFIASKEEDESRITCGNAILADKGKKE